LKAEQHRRHDSDGFRLITGPTRRYRVSEIFESAPLRAESKAIVPDFLTCQSHVKMTRLALLLLAVGLAVADYTTLWPQPQNLITGSGSSVNNCFSFFSCCVAGRLRLPQHLLGLTLLTCHKACTPAIVCLCAQLLGASFTIVLSTDAGCASSPILTNAVARYTPLMFWNGAHAHRSSRC
jgi:hypothetical protein